MKTSTGIEVLDKQLGGGFPQGSSVLIDALPGVDDIQFMHQMLIAHLSKGGKGIYVVNNKKPAVIKAMMNDFDWDITQFESDRRCIFLDYYSCIADFCERQPNLSTRTSGLDDLWNELVFESKDSETPLMVVLDSLSSLLDQSKNDTDVLRFLQKTISTLRSRNASLVALFTRWPYEESTIKLIKNEFDCVIKLDAIERNIIAHSYFSVSKVRWIEGFAKKDIPYTVVKPGGVKGFIPKILVTGPYHSGKTSFIHSASTRAVSVQRFGTTIALDHGHVDYKGFSFDLFGTPGQERFDPILELLGSTAFGVVLVVDATDRNSMIRAKELIRLTKTENIPIVIAANKANLPGAMDVTKIKNEMTITEDVPIVEVVAEDISQVVENRPCKLNKTDVDRVIDRLFEVMI